MKKGCDQEHGVRRANTQGCRQFNRGNSATLSVSPSFKLAKERPEKDSIRILCKSLNDALSRRGM